MECRYALSSCDAGVTFDPGSARMFPTVMCEIYFYHKDILILQPIVVCAFT